MWCSWLSYYAALLPSDNGIQQHHEQPRNFHSPLCFSVHHRIAFSFLAADIGCQWALSHPPQLPVCWAGSVSFLLPHPPQGCPRTDYQANCQLQTQPTFLKDALYCSSCTPCTKFKSQLTVLGLATSRTVFYGDTSALLTLDLRAFQEQWERTATTTLLCSLPSRGDEWGVWCTHQNEFWSDMHWTWKLHMHSFQAKRGWRGHILHDDEASIDSDVNRNASLLKWVLMDSVQTCAYSEIHMVNGQPRCSCECNVPRFGSNLSPGARDNPWPSLIATSLLSGSFNHR